MAYIPRGANGRSQVNDPVNPKDIANKQYVDSAPPYNDPASNQLSDFSFDNWNGTAFTQWTTFWKTGTITSINQVTGAGTNAVDTNAFQVTFGAASSIQRVGGTVVAVTAGQYFQLSIWAKGTGTSPTVEIDFLYNTASTTVDFFQTGVQNATVLAATNLTSTWTLYTGYFLIPTGYTYGRMYITTGGGSAATVSLDRATMRIAIAPTAFNGVPAGGSAAALLIKNSATDYDYTWGAAATTGTASTYMLRDASGRSQVADPSAALDIANKEYVDAFQTTNLIGTTITNGSITAVADTFYIVTLAASMGSQIVTLPSAPANGTVIKFVRTDTNVTTSFFNITRGGTDVIQTGTGTTSVYTLSMTGGIISLTYVSGIWYVDASVSGLDIGVGVKAASTTNTSGSVMIRDGSGRSQVTDPSSAQDITTKNYVDNLTGILYYEENNINNFALVSGWQAANSSGSTPLLKGQYSSSVDWTAAKLTAPVAGVYDFGMSFYAGTMSGASRLIGEFTSGSLGTGQIYFRQEIDVTGASATGTPAISMTGKKYLTAGATLYACIFASGGAIGVTITGEYMYFSLQAKG